MADKIEQRVSQAISEKVFPGCVIGIVRKDERREVLPFGKLIYEPDAPAVGADTIYDVASVTKSIPVASLALTFISEGKLKLGGKVVTYIPEFRNDHGATIEDLLRYRVKGPQMSRLNFKTFEQMRTYIFEHGFDGPPGESVYTNLPAYMLGVVLERVSGEILPALAEQYFFGPLVMSDTTFFPHDIARIAPTEIVDDQEIRGVVHDESARVFAEARRAVGHAGLFSTAGDLLNFLEALLRGQFPAIVEGAERGLGWQSHQPWFMGKNCTERTFGKTGFTGASVLCDGEHDVALVILSNRTYPKRSADTASLTSAMNIFRRDIADIVLDINA